MNRGALSTALSAAIIVVLAAAAVLAIDPLNRLSLQVALDDLHNRQWYTGVWCDYHFPPTASPGDIALAFGGIGSRGAHVVEIRKLWRPGFSGSEPYYGVWVTTPKGSLRLVIHHRHGDDWEARGQ